MKPIFVAIFFLLIVFFTGCSTTNTVTTYDSAGNIVKIEEVETGAIDKLIESVKDKSLVIWKSGWAAYVAASPATTQDPTPTVKMFAGKIDEGYISVHKDAEDIDWDGVAKAISATNKSLNISVAGIKEE